MDGQQGFHCFQFNDKALSDQYVQLSFTNDMPLVIYTNNILSIVGNASCIEFNAQGCFINFL